MPKIERIVLFPRVHLRPKPIIIMIERASPWQTFTPDIWGPAYVILNAA
jgi:hypothetical protein